MLNATSTGGFADGARNDNEGNVAAGLLDDFERIRRAELGEVVIGDDEVPLAVKGVLELLRGFDALVLKFVATLAEHADQQRGVEIRIFNQEHPQRLSHALILCSSARSVKGWSKKRG